MNILWRIFEDYLILRSEDITQPVRSPDITAPYFFLWSYLKTKEFKNCPHTM
jgi:hypothetical protein